MTVCLERFWHNRGHLVECAQFLRRGLDAARDVSPELRCAALNLAGQTELRYDTESSRAYFTEALGIARGIGDDRSTATALWGLSLVHRYAGDAKKQAACASGAVGIARSLGDAVLLGECLLASSEYLRFKLPAVADESRLYELLEVTSRSGDRIYEALAHNNFGDWALIAGDLETARDHLEQAQAIYAEIGKFEPVLASNLGWVSFAHGDLTAAQATFAKAMQMAELHRVRWHGSLAILGLGCVAAARRDWERRQAVRLRGRRQANCRAVCARPRKPTGNSRPGKLNTRSGRSASPVSMNPGKTDRGSLVDFTLGRSTSPLGSSENPGLSPLTLPASHLNSPVGDQSPHAYCPSRRQAQHLGARAAIAARHAPSPGPPARFSPGRAAQPASRQYPCPTRSRRRVGARLSTDTFRVRRAVAPWLWPNASDRPYIHAMAPAGVNVRICRKQGRAPRVARDLDHAHVVGRQL